MKKHLEKLLEIRDVSKRRDLLVRAGLAEEEIEVLAGLACGEETADGDNGQRAAQLEEIKQRLRSRGKEVGGFVLQVQKRLKTKPRVGQ